MLRFSSFKLRPVVPLLAALCALAPVFRARAQDAPSPQKDDEEVVRISTDLVQTDVMVFDRAGKFVDGLKPEQFELKVDGRPQQIVFFDRVQAGTVNEDAQLAAARGVKSGAGVGVLPLDRGRTVIFFVDDLPLSAGSAANIRGTLRRFIDEEIGQNDEAAVISASGQVGFLQQFTDNKAVLRAGTSRINTRVYTIRDGQSPSMTEVHALAVERGDNSVLDFFVDALLRDNPVMRREMAEQLVETRARRILQQSAGVSVNTLASLRSVFAAASPLPGRKVLFFTSDGFVVDEIGGSLREQMRSVADAAARAGVVIYSLDAAGLRSVQEDASSAGTFDPAGRLSQTNMSEGSTLQAPLFALANETGGRALVNSNALLHSVSGALKETALYYLLAWKPASSGGEPKYQRIDVSVKGRADLRVIVRRGFINSQPASEAPAKEVPKNKKAETAGAEQQPKSAAERELLAALRSPLPRAGIATSLALGYVNATDGKALLTASVELDRSSLTFSQDEKPRAEFDLLCAVIDDRGKTLLSFGKSLGFTLDAAAPESRQHVVYTFQAALAPGLYQVRVVARDSRSGRTGSALQWVEIPDFKQRGVQLSSIFLGERTPDEGAVAAGPEDAVQSVHLNVARRFARTSSIRFLAYVYNAPAGAPPPPPVSLPGPNFPAKQPGLSPPPHQGQNARLSGTP